MAKVLGIAGTAKNTGKTTTLLEVLRYLADRGTKVCVTSIGYDGEDFDNVTGLPKPRVVIPEGTFVATALPMMRSSSADFDELTDTRVDSPLGPVYLGRATRRGKVVLAGPTSSPALQEILGLIPEECVTLVDGAFGRMAPMTLAPAIILATGAARNPDPAAIAAEINAIAAIASLPRASPERSPQADIAATRTGNPGMAVSVVHRSAVMRSPLAAEDTPRAGSDNGYAGPHVLRWPAVSASDAPVRELEELGPGMAILDGLYAKGQAETLASFLARAHSETATVYIRGAVNPEVLDEALGQLEHYRRSGILTVNSIALLASHPIMMLVSGQPVKWHAVVPRLERLGCSLSVQSRLKLLGVTLSSYMPRYDSDKRRFEASRVCAPRFLQEVRERIAVPCTDLFLEGPEKLHEWLDAYLSQPDSQPGESIFTTTPDNSWIGK